MTCSKPYHNNILIMLYSVYFGLCCISLKYLYQSEYGVQEICQFLNQALYKLSVKRSLSLLQK